MTRVLGRSDIEVSALGVVTWALGGPITDGAQEHGWGPVDDEESVRSLRRAAEPGVTSFDTADSCGAGHAERASVVLASTQAHGLASVIRSPLATGLLTEPVTAGTVIGPGDVRHAPPPWLRWFTGGRPDPVHPARRGAAQSAPAADGRRAAGPHARRTSRSGQSSPRAARSRRAAVAASVTSLVMYPARAAVSMAPTFSAPTATAMVEGMSFSCCRVMPINRSLPG